MTNTNRTTDSMTAMLHQTKSCYTITDKSTGQVLGHAFMQVEGQVTADQVQLFPYQEPGLENLQPLLPSSSLHDEAEFRGILESDLDLSEDSSMNATVEEEFSSQTCNMKKCPELSTHQADLDVEILQSRSVPSNGEDQANQPSVIQTASTSFKQASSLPGNAKSVTQLLAAQILSEMRCGEVRKKNSLMNISNVESRNETAEQKHLEYQVTGKRKSDFDEQPAKKVNHGDRFATGKYEALYTEEGVEQRDNQKHKNRRVRCLLCPDGRTLVLGNFGMHVKALHLEDVKCEGCGEEFKASKIHLHKKKCLVEKDSRSVVNNETQNMVSSQRSQPESVPSPKYTQPQDSVNMSSSSELFVSDTSFASCASSLVLETQQNVNITNNNLVLSKNLCEERSDEVDMITFILTSAAKESIKIKTVMDGKMKKVMKKFGEKLCVDIQGLKFLLGGVKLSGEELAGKLEGRNIVVLGRLH